MTSINQTWKHAWWTDGSWYRSGEPREWIGPAPLTSSVRDVRNPESDWEIIFDDDVTIVAFSVRQKRVLLMCTTPPRSRA